MNRCVELLVVGVTLVGCASEPRPDAVPPNQPIRARTPTPEHSPQVVAAPSREPAAAAALPDWSFTEYRQSWADTAESIELFPDGTFSRKSWGHLARTPVEKRGRVRHVDGWLELEQESPTGSRWKLTCCVARHREQRVLLRKTEVVEFANAVNGGLLNPFRYLHANEPASAIEPQLELVLPPELLRYFLREPVIATVLGVREVQRPGSKGVRLELTVDKGSADGLCVGMEFWSLDPALVDIMAWPATLTEVGEHSSLARAFRTKLVPAIGTQMSTRHPRAAH
ncbi:MAG: hypothetical protein HZA52_10630 [Planctomycetes bacterium]|nr:hypothetical protein [Planctomycetota bacterium]